MYRILAIIQVFVGVGAVAGGTGAILNPEGPLGISVDILKNSPFDNFFIPGIILFTVIGLCNIISGIMLCKKLKYCQYMGSVMAWALVIWIVVQCIMLNTINYLHVIYFVIGLFEVLISTIILYKERLYPVNIFTRNIKR